MRHRTHQLDFLTRLRRVRASSAFTILEVMIGSTMVALAIGAGAAAC